MLTSSRRRYSSKGMGRRCLPSLLCLLAATCWGQLLGIHQVQGDGNRSPHEGERVRVRGVVTGVSTSGFFLQDVQPDQDPRTSEGLFVYLGAPPVVSPGKVVEVEGLVREYVPAADPACPPLTELVSPRWEVVGTAELPPPVSLTVDLPNGWELTQLEALEGMRVEVEELVVSGPTLGSVDETAMLASSRGVFFGVVAGRPRPFREPGFPPWDPVPAGNPPLFDGNPEVLRVDSLCLLGGRPLDTAAGSLVRGLRGPLTFASRRYTLCPEAEPTLLPPLPPPPAPPPPPGTLLLASWNLQRFFDDQNDPMRDEPVLSPEAFHRRVKKLVRALADFCQLPQVLLLQEVENQAVLAALAERLGREAQARWGETTGFSTYFVPGSDGSGLGLGLLVADQRRGVRVQVRETRAVLGAEELANPDGSRSPLFDRPPLFALLHLSAPRRQALTLAVVGVHLRSMNGLLSLEPGSRGWPTEGARVRAKRAGQAEALARFVSQFQGQNLLVVGDFNAFEFSDGVVDVVGTVAGFPDPQVVLPTGDWVSGDLLVLTHRELASQRFSYVYDGSAQALDHALASQELAALGLQLWRPRLAADWPEVARNGDGPWRVSDHDPLLVWLPLPRVPARALPRPRRSRP